ncbi:hypothetical protein Zmor_009400 [Zophobas morio]|uniref:RNA helicase n=1 Tax=Zophobas morio TaxID=2755281 RepID=A0AA38IGN2_9CUCU|nr:hypothetical protein Zmor_009400 [Zophobas morio]
MKHPQACAQKFALYVYKNNHLGESFVITKTEAQKLYEAFKMEHRTQVGFRTVLNYSKGFLTRVERDTVLVYNERKLLRLKENEANIDMAFNTSDSAQMNNSSGYASVSPEKYDVFSEKVCNFCGIKFLKQEDFETHLSEKEHVFLCDLDRAFKIARIIPSPLEFTINGSPDLKSIIMRKNIPKTFFLRVRNSSPKTVAILSIQTHPKITEVGFKPVCPSKILPSSTVTWELTVLVQNEILSYPILVKIENKEILNVAVQLVFHAHDEFFDDLHPVAPFQRFEKFIDDDLDNVENGEFPPWPPTKASLMKQYHIPSDLAAILNANFTTNQAMSTKQQAELENIKGLIDNDNKQASLQVQKNYTKLLKVLLHMEEHQMSKDMRGYDRNEQTLKKRGHFVELEVPDLAERRPSILVSDVVRVKDPNHNKVLYNGVIQQVKESSVVLRFSRKFMDRVFAPHIKFHVGFTFNRFCLRAQHQAIELTNSDNIAHFFFPKVIPNTVCPRIELAWFNKDVGNNPEQQQAVRAILQKSAMPAPYLVFGPPGTGKTMTLVESVKQIYQRTNEKVLVCTPSNSAANELTKRLTDTVPAGDLFRYVAISFSDHMPQELIRYSNFQRGTFYHPVMDEIVRYRIVITTLITAVKLVNKNCPKNHFTYVFIDEAGQATESETLVPIARILSRKEKTGCIFGQIVLAGDPRQLGPVIHSTLAKECGLGTSMLERLIDTCPQYQKNQSGKYNPCALTKLLKNYRSHPVILNQPNELFYENELQIAGDNLINACVNWEVLPNKDFPLIFHSVIGEDQREQNSPSFFNIQEIQVIVDYLDKLVGCRMQGVTVRQQDIMVVSPYKKQVDKLKQACKKKGYEGLFVGSVEQVQGQERLVVIVSTVRSKTQLLGYDLKYHLGFLNNPKRFNVAITRAKALLIVVGNPKVLQLDKYWGSLIEYCRNNGAIVGEKMEPESDETLSDAQNMSLLGESKSGLNESDWVVEETSTEEPSSI